MPTSGLACKHQLRGTGCRAGLRTDSTMREVGARVQRKLFMGIIEALEGDDCSRRDSRLGCLATAKPSAL